MVKAVMSTMTMSMIVADDVTSLLQLSTSARQSQGQRILAAVAEEGNDTICVEAASGDVAPVAGSFTAMGSQQVVVVEAGSVAEEAGSFCVAKQDVLLIQRTWGLNTAGDFEAALGSKKNKATTTTTTVPWADFDFAGNLTKKVTVKADGCPKVEAGLVQTMDASVSDKQQKKANKNKLDADQLKVCGCRNFLKSTVDTPNFVETLEKLQADAVAAAQADAGEDAPETNLLQRNFDTALASKKTAKKATTSTTTTTTTIDHKLTAEFAALAKACTVASQLPGSWTAAAKEINNPSYFALYESFNITGGWQHCHKSWLMQGACDEFVLPNTGEVFGANTHDMTGEDPYANIKDPFATVDRIARN